MIICLSVLCRGEERAAAIPLSSGHALLLLLLLLLFVVVPHLLSPRNSLGCCVAVCRSEIGPTPATPSTTSPLTQVGSRGCQGQGRGLTLNPNWGKAVQVGTATPLRPISAPSYQCPTLSSACCIGALPYQCPTPSTCYLYIPICAAGVDATASPERLHLRA